MDWDEIAKKALTKSIEEQVAMKINGGDKLIGFDIGTTGMTCVATSAVEDGVAYLINLETIQREMFQVRDMWFKPWDQDKCPEGFEPKIRIRKFWWMDRDFERQQNNWLIDMFGIVEVVERFKFKPGFTHIAMNPNAIAKMNCAS